LPLRALPEAVRNRLFYARKQHNKAGLLPALTPLALTTIAITTMPTFTDKLTCGTIAFFAAIFVSFGQASAPAPETNPDQQTAAKTPSGPSTNPAKSADKSASAPAPLTVVQATSTTSTPAAVKPAPPQPSTSTPATTTVPPVAADTVTESGGVGVREFQGDDVGQVLRLLARQAKINMVVSDQVTGTVTMRLEDVTALEAVAIIVKAKGLFMDQIDHVYYIKTPAEKTAEPTESDSYQFSYSRAKEVAPLLASQLSSKDPPQFDERTNTIFFRETRSNIDTVRKLLVTIDKPTKQVMIEARLVEVTANPLQSYGIDWAGTVGSASQGKTFSYGSPQSGTNTSTGGKVPLNDLALGNPQNPNILGNFSKLIPGQFAILTVPQMSATLRFLNEDADAEFLANPRIVTADNLQAKIEINRAQPVPQLNFNEQTATAVFGGFQDKKFGNTLIVTPSINKDNFVTLKVKPEISNKVGDSTFVFAGATVSSPIIDTRALESNVLIRSGDTLAIGGLIQDEVAKTQNKVPLLGDVPVLGYLFQNHLNARTKRNLLVFVTPTIIDSKYGTGLEDQVSGLHHVGEEYSDINGWRNNAQGAVRLVPTGHRQVVADYPKPGTPPPPAVGESDVQFKSSAKDRDF
jgi:type IV pilus secretin PilQ/predicted competence protein